MRAKDYSVTQVLIGTHRVGLVGLQGCLQAAEKSGLEDREAIIDLMMEELSASNFIHDARIEEYRTAVWREYLRHLGEDFSEFYSEIPVVIRGGTDENRDRLARMTAAAPTHATRKIPRLSAAEPRRSTHAGTAPQMSRPWEKLCVPTTAAD